jgi:DNA (cytosine-5)-methyltransferase 1
MKEPRKRKEQFAAVSLFCGAGIGDVGFRAAGLEFIAHCELEPDRARLAQLNFPCAKIFAADVRDVKAPLCRFVEQKLAAAKQPLFLVTCTAPCQGMSRNGQGTLLANIRKGKRPLLDPRNRLILPALDVIGRLRPTWVVFENVVEMRNTVIEDEAGELRNILDVIRRALSPAGYVGAAYDVEMADHGIPQRRQRLITVFTRGQVAARRFELGASFVPTPTHAKSPTRHLKPWVSVSEALSGFPALDAADAARASAAHVPFHRPRTATCEGRMASTEPIATRPSIAKSAARYCRDLTCYRRMAPSASCLGTSALTSAWTRTCPRRRSREISATRAATRSCTRARIAFFPSPKP